MERKMGRGGRRARAHPLALDLTLVRPVRVRARGFALIPTPRGGGRPPGRRASARWVRGARLLGGREGRRRRSRVSRRDARMSRGGARRRSRRANTRWRTSERSSSRMSTSYRCLSPLVSGGVRRWRGEESDASCTEVVCKSPVAPVFRKLSCLRCFTGVRRVHRPSRAHRSRSFAARSASSHTRKLISCPLSPARTTHAPRYEPRRRQL